MYFTTDYPSKAAAKRALASGERVTVYATSEFEDLRDGSHYVEGPHYPKPHTFYGSVILKDGVVTAIK